MYGPLDYSYGATFLKLQMDHEIKNIAKAEKEVQICAIEAVADLADDEDIDTPEDRKDDELKLTEDLMKLRECLFGTDQQLALKNGKKSFIMQYHNGFRMYSEPLTKLYQNP